MGINLGAFTCNLVCGWLAARFGWHYGFGAATIGMILGLLLYISLRPRYLAGVGEPIAGKVSLAPAFLPIGLILAAAVGGLYHKGILGLFDQAVSHPLAYWAIAAAAVGLALWFILKQAPGDRGPVLTIFIYMLFNAIFWMSFEQAGSSLTTFTDELTDRSVAGVTVPTPFFQSINPLLIIIFAPLFGVVWATLARRNKSFAQPFKIGAGLVFVGLGYVVMVLAAVRLNTGIPKVSMIYIAGCYFLHTVGEIILSPTGLSYVSKTAPRKHVSSLMGIWFISSFIAGLGAGKVAALVDPIIEGDMKLPWNLGGQADFFLLFVVTSCAAGGLIIVLAPMLARLQRNPKD
jgi:proton-dependent oligopeptide transporter, POT family